MNPTAIPQRSSLVAETIRVLREAIQSGRWKQHLPGERRLCEEWHISRPTLRAALSALASEGLLTITQGKPTALISTAIQSSEVAPKSLTICLLSPEPLHAMPPFTLLWLDELRSQLASEGHLLQVQGGRSWSAGKNPARALAALTSTTPAAAWILYRSTEAMQRWFSEQKHIPSVVVGSVFAGVSLPSVDRDYRAVCRHAVGTLAVKGHTQVGLLIQEPQFAGDRESEAGFLEGVEAANLRDVKGHIFRHDGTRTGLLKTLDLLLARRPHRPSALIIARSACALTACTGLLQRGVRIPQDMALICRDDDLFLDETAPQIARYSVPATAFAKRLFRLVRQPGARGDTKVMPNYVKRESV